MSHFIIPFGLSILILMLVLVFLFWTENFTTMQTALGHSQQDSSDTTVSPLLTDMDGNPTTLETGKGMDVKRYIPDKYDVTYHEISKSTEFYNTDLSSIRVLDNSGNLILLPYAPSQNLPVYYDIQKYPHGLPQQVVPTYRESILLEHAKFLRNIL